MHEEDAEAQSDDGDGEALTLNNAEEALELILDDTTTTPSTGEEAALAMNSIRRRREAKLGYIDESTRTVYRNHNKRLLLFLYEKREVVPAVGNNEESREKYGSVLNDVVVQEMQSASHKGNKAQELLLRASRSFHPINLLKLQEDPDIFIDFLLSRVGRGGGQYLAATTYGGYRAALNDLFRTSGVTKSREFEDEITRISETYKVVT